MLSVDAATPLAACTLLTTFLPSTGKESKRRPMPSTFDYCPKECLMPLWLRSGFLISALLIATVAHAEGTFRAGTAEVDITPAKPMPMWGYGARHALLSVGTRDPLFAKVVVLEAGKT